MGKFLDQDTLYRILQRELPDGLYPIGAPAGSYSNAELDSTAKVFSLCYDAASAIFKNIYPQTCAEQLNEWEIKVFGTTNTDGASTEDRVGRIISQVRSAVNLSTWDLQVGLAGMIPGVFVQIIENWTNYELGSYDCRGSNSYLIWGQGWTMGDPLPANAYCEQYILDDYAQMELLRIRAYRYQVKVYSTSLSDEVKAAIEEYLTRNEAARSDHTIQYLDYPFNTYKEVDRFSKNIVVRMLSDGTLQGADLALKFGFDEDASAAGFGSTLDTEVGGEFYSLT